MRVFCPEHQRGCLSPRRNPIKCPRGTHLLGELDFAGSAKLPVEVRWSYCCNCEHFWPAGPDGQAIQRCPVCERQLSAGYLCDHCYTLTLESPTPADLK